ncbi:STAS domain-containing protein [Actinoplanes sp. NPDC049265]|uniref:STAS domain-containing protein n=1 Tax=Actinoplanes sp. NPDC049265 TaxID=3363902 RepID=UPI00370FFD39
MEDPYTLSADPPVLALAGEFDLSARDELTSALLRVVTDPGTTTVVLDVSRTTFIDSEALAAVIIGVNAARDLGKRFEITGATGVVHRVMDVAGLLDLIDDHRHSP